MRAFLVAILSVAAAGLGAPASAEKPSIVKRTRARIEYRRLTKDHTVQYIERHEKARHKVADKLERARLDTYLATVNGLGAAGFAALTLFSKDGWVKAVSFGTLLLPSMLASKHAADAVGSVKEARLALRRTREATVRRAVRLGDGTVSDQQLKVFHEAGWRTPAPAK